MATVPVSEVKSNTREGRTAAHSHIKGLGLSSDGRATPAAGGFIGQAAAREVQSAPVSFTSLVVLTRQRHVDWSSTLSKRRRCRGEQCYSQAALGPVKRPSRWPSVRNWAQKCPSARLSAVRFTPQRSRRRRRLWRTSGEQ
jgi:hypothetical protein